MSVLPVMEKLLEGVEVEWKALREIAIYSKDRVASNLLNEQNYIGVDNLLPNKLGKTYSSHVPTDGFSTQYITGDILVGNIRPYLKKIWLADSVGGTNGDVLVVRAISSNVRPDYLYQVLSDDKFFAFNMQYAKGAKMPRGDKNRIMDYEIPIPPLAVQSEIVRILDAFTTYTAELTAELTARKKQYNYYRDQLLSFSEDEVEWKTLEEVTVGVASGRNKSRSSEGNFPVYGSTGQIGFCEKAEHIGEMLLIARVGAYAGLVNFVTGQFDVSDNTLIVRPTEEWNVRFAFHQLSNMNLNKYAVGAGQPLITGGLLKSLKLPIPPYDEQLRVASILDKFDALTASITEGLPREIELRQQQYEYYRDRLLSFPKPANDAAA